MPMWLALAVLAMPPAVILLGLLMAVRGWRPNSRWRHPRSAGIFGVVMGSIGVLQEAAYAARYALNWPPPSWSLLQLTALATGVAGGVTVLVLELRSRTNAKAGR